jgi:hypothetical protein
MNKIQVYINSVKPSAVDYIDMKSVEHPCSQAGERAFQGLRDFPWHLSGFVSDDEREAIDLVEQFSKENRLDYEIIDLANAGVATRLKFIMRRWKAPIITWGKVTLKGLPTREQLERILKNEALG